MYEKIEYTSPLGYHGVFYGKSSYAIYDKRGIEVFHTGFRAINTYKELKEQVDEFPEFLKILRRKTDDGTTESDDGI